MNEKSKLQELIEEAGFVCCSYSGRAMYGERCLGVVIEGGPSSNPANLGAFISALVEAAVARTFDKGFV